jgi:hypothetical protein
MVAGEWVGNLLWWRGLAAGIFVLCIALIWATQEEWVVLPSGRHRQLPRHGPHNPWLKKIQQMIEGIGTWLMMISISQAEPSQGAERRGTLAAFITVGQSEPGSCGGATPRQEHPNEPWGTHVHTNRGQQYPTRTTLDSG